MKLVMVQFRKWKVNAWRANVLVYLPYIEHELTVMLKLMTNWLSFTFGEML